MEAGLLGDIVLCWGEGALLGLRGGVGDGEAPDGGPLGGLCSCATGACA